MTDRHAAYIVTLAADIREDDAEESILIALRMLKGVIAVEPVIAEHEMVIARNRRDCQWEQALRELLRNGPPSGL